MISGGFPTDTTAQITAANFYPTDIFKNLEITDPEFSPNYWTGWVAWDDVPTVWHVTRGIFEDDTIKFSDVTEPENVNIGFVGNIGTANLQRLYTPMNYVYDDDLGKWRLWQYHQNTQIDDYTRLLNEFDVNTQTCNDIILQITVSINSQTEAIGEIHLTIAEIMSKHWSRTIDKTVIGAVSGVAVPSTLSFTIDQDDLDGTLKEIEVDNNVIKYSFAAFRSSNEHPITSSGSSTSSFTICPFIKIHDEDDRAYLVGIAGLPPLSSWRQGGYSVNASTGNLMKYAYDYIENDIYLGGYVGEMPGDLIRGTAGNHDMISAPGCNFCVQGTGRSISVLRRMVSYEDILKFAALYTRFGTLREYETNADKIYPHVSPDEQFLGELINGESDFDELRPWQIAGTTVNPETNDYKESDKPPYIPPEGDDKEKIGDSIGFNINVPGGTATGLYTMYALRQAHISNLGAALWTSFNSSDSNFWQNVRMAVGLYEEAGSFDLSTILDFIASIRIYPFALINLPGYAGAGTGAIKMGTGKIPLDLSAGGAGNVGIMGSYTGIIDAGSVTIPAHYGDFRDLEGVTMSVYLPYIGNVALNPAEVTGQTLQATYAVDLTSGSCVAYLLLSGSWGYYPIGVYSGTIGADIPLSASQGNRMFLRDLKNVLGLGSILGGSLSGVDATDGDALAGAIGSGLASGAAYMTKNIYQQGMGAALTPPTLGGGGANFAGFGAPQTAYVQIRRHLYAYTARTFPADQMGRRTYGVKVLGTLSGFTVCDAVDVSGIPAPADIQTDIKKALESGVYL